MTDHTIELDGRRGMAAQKATDLRRLLTQVEAQRAALQARQEELERHLLAAPAESWHEVVAKVRYVLGIFAATPAAADPRREKLIADILSDFDRLLSEQPDPPT